MTAQTRQAGADPVLVVQSGPQRDARAAVTASAQTVGHGIDCDLVLFDPALADTHFSLAHEPDGVRLSAIGGSILLADGAGLAPGASALRGASTRFHAGSTEFRLDIPAHPATKGAPVRRQSSWARRSGIGIGAFCILLATATGIDAGPPAAQTAVLPLPARADAKAAPVTFGTAQASDPLQAARTRLASAGIDSIALATLPDGSIEARGQIAPGQQPAWREVERWFDGAFGGRSVLVEQIRVVAEAPPLVIQAVWPGRNPYVVDGGGQKMFVGATLPGGWAIEGILPDRVVLRRGGQALAVRF